MKRALLFILVAALAAGGGWFAARRFPAAPAGAKPAATGERKVSFYQSPMHPWIKSDQPGNCTICGMKLVAVYEGEKGFGDSAEGVVTLGSNIIQVIHVQGDEVRKRPVVRTLRVAGTIEDDDTRHKRLSAYIDGRIDKLHVNFVGAEVTAGQPLATFYSPMLLTVESEYLSVVNQPPPASEVLRSERDRIVEGAAVRLRRLGYSDEQIAALGKKAEASAQRDLLAPMSGTVVMRNVYEGQYVKEGELLFELADFAQMWFQFDAYERDLAWLRPGQPVEVTSPALPGKTFTAPITFIDPNLNDMTRSARVRVVLENPLVEDGARKRRLLFHRMYADGAVKIEAPDVLAVPRSAVLAGGPVALAYVDLGGGAFEQRKLKLGRQGDELVEVLDGLAAGERVVTAGNLLIDSQAQLNAAVAGMSTTDTTNMMAAETATLTSLNETQKVVGAEFLKAAGAVGAALAEDSLVRFNATAPAAHALVPKLIDAFANVKSLRPALQKLETGGHLSKAADLPAARKEFLPFSMATVELAVQLRTTETFKGVKIYNCPMVNQAVPGAAKNGRWVQMAGPLRNPYFGSDMLECGTEVK
jgi:Cu(I)/Ag(I) efflux system membrane fusion protein